jgi:transcriptional regulator with XRE-family HTH domain
MLMNSSMKFSSAFRETMFRYELRGSELSKRSGVSNAQISKFRSGQNVTIATLEKLLSALLSISRPLKTVAALTRP